MQLIQGKSYVTRNGTKVGPVILVKSTEGDWFTSVIPVSIYIPIWNPDGSADFFEEPLDGGQEEEDNYRRQEEANYNFSIVKELDID